jgi:hypothetical protein
MSVNRDVPRFIILNPVKPERADEFETFIREVVDPAATQARPDAVGLWQVLRPGTGAGPAQLLDAPGVTAAAESTYVFVFFGDLPLDDWDLGPVFTEVHGEERASELMQQFGDFLAGDQVIYEFSGQL